MRQSPYSYLSGKKAGAAPGPAERDARMEAIVPERLAETLKDCGLRAQANTSALLALPLALLGLSLGAASTAVQAATCVEEYCYD